jgi:hypothetical protein
MQFVDNTGAWPLVELDVRQEFGCPRPQSADGQRSHQSRHHRFPDFGPNTKSIHTASVGLSGFLVIARFYDRRIL